MSKNSQQNVVFSWGYWGWGSTSNQFVESVDRIEKARGFAPPLFVDVRLRRSVRAAGFREGAFAQATASERYIWMNALGNRNLDSGEMALKDPAAASLLLRLADDCASKQARLIFFCACPKPIDCHRSLVAKTLLTVAKKLKRPLTVVEWPGTELPASPLYWNVSPATLAAVKGGHKSFDLPTNVEVSEGASIAWYTPVILRAGDAELRILAGPAVVQRERWVIRVLVDPFEPGVSVRDMQRAAIAERAALGYELQA